MIMRPLIENIGHDMKMATRKDEAEAGRKVTKGNIKKGAIGRM